MVYKWKEANHPNIPADVAGRVCNELAQRNELTTKNLVEVSRPENAPLHDAFEWDDAVAGEEWRKHQAGQIIRCIVINPSEEDKKKDVQVVRAFFPTTQSDSGNLKQYEHITTIMKSEDKKNIMLNNALRELKWFKEKYKTLQELDSVFREIDALLEKVV